MPKFSLTQAFIAMVIVSAAMAAVSYSITTWATFDTEISVVESNIALGFVMTLLTISFILAFALKGAGRAFHVGFVVAAGGYLAQHFEMLFPPQMYLCGYHGFTHVIHHSLLAVSMGCVGGLTGWYMRSMPPYSGMKRSQLTQNVIVWALPTIVILAVVPWLIENSSKEFAVFLIHATNALFYMALLGVLYRQGSLRVFWAFFAIAAWLYLFAETRYLPHIYYLSPAPYLSIFSDYHNSISKAEVIGDSLAMLCVAWNVGWLARVGYVAVLWILYRAYLGLALQWMFCGNRCQGARQIVQGP